MKENILQLIQNFIQGGSERQMIQLTRLLREADRYRVHVACLNREGPLRKELEKIGHDIPEFPLTSFYDVNMLVQLRLFTAYLKQNNISLVHTHDFYSNVFGMAGAMLARVPVRVASRREIGGIRTPAQKKVEQMAFRLATRVVVNAEAVREQLVAEGVAREKVTVVYNGLDLDRMTAMPRSRADTLALLGLPERMINSSYKVVTIVANMRHHVKDHPMFLRSARKVLEGVPETAFLLAGEGELLGSLRALAAELGITDNTFFLGRCDHVPELLSVSDLCVLSSKAEGFSNSILEYMAAGRPVVATDVGGAREAIIEGQTGYLVETGDSLRMAARIVELLRNPERALRMGEMGRRIVEDRFSCAAQLSNTEGLYGELLRQTRQRTAPGSESAAPEGTNRG